MTLHRGWLAREWFYLLGGLAWAFVSLYYLPVSTAANRLLIAATPYVFVQIVRITVWAIRTLRGEK